ncbi:MAG: hypothetical protein ACYC2T_02220 [Bacillota bacterium]
MNPIEWLRGKKMLVLGFILGIMISLGGLYGARVGLPRIPIAGAVESGVLQESTTGTLPGVSAHQIANIVKKTGPAVVKI